MRLIVLLSLILMLEPWVTQAQQKSKIELLNSRFIKSDKSIHDGARRLIGSVKFKQDSTIMECDSAYFYADKNMFDAFGHVHLYKMGDSEIDVRSDFLRHNGDIKMAHFRKNVVMHDKQVILKTDSLDYDIRSDIGYYLYGAEIVDSATTLISKKGHYYNHENTIYFKTDVVINHNFDEYQLYTDTIRYNTITERAYFFGPTKLINDSNYMYAEYGWYDTRTNEGFFQQNALYTNPNQSLEADSIYIDRDREIGKAYSNIVVTDTTQDMVVTGNYLEAKKEFQHIFVTDSAQLISILEGDTLFMHADTLEVYSVTDTMHLALIDSLPVDSLNPLRDSIYDYRVFKGYFKVKIFKSNFQSKCDSLFFSMKDSIVEFHGSPVLWAEGSQITAEYIEGFIKNQTLDKFKLYETGLIVSLQDSTHFNQIKGREVTGYFRDNELYKIDVETKSETIYFPTDDNEIVGVNKANSKNITIYMRNNKVKRIVYRTKPIATMYPLKDLGPKDMIMKEFVWLDGVRPKSPSDIFIWDSNEK